MGPVNGELVVYDEKVPGAYEIFLILDVVNHTIYAAHAVALAQFPGGDAEGASEGTAAAGLEQLEPHSLFPEELGLAPAHVPVDQLQIGDRVNLMCVVTVRVVPDSPVVTVRKTQDIA